MSQSHGAWLDLTLAIGIPGVFIILLAAFLAIRNAKALPSPWHAFAVWFLGSAILLMISTEVGQKDYVETLILMIVFLLR